MNKIYLDGVLVVEGRSDQAKISTFLSSPIITTNGTDVNEPLLSLLSRASKTRNIYLFLDDDDAGRRIQEKIMKFVEKPVILSLKPTYFTNQKKHGNAEIPYKDLYEYFSSIKSNHQCNFSVVTPSEIAYKELMSPGYKKELIDRYNLIDGNNKFIATQMSILGLKL